MGYTKGEWKAYKDDFGKYSYAIDLKHTGHEKQYTEIAYVCNEDDAHLIAAAVNACISVNPDNPQAVAESMKDMYEALKEITQSMRDLVIKYGNGIIPDEAPLGEVLTHDK